MRDQKSAKKSSKILFGGNVRTLRAVPICNDMNRYIICLVLILFLFVLSECTKNSLNCVFCQKTLTKCQRKNSRPAITYLEELSFHITSHELNPDARICSACRCAVSKSRKSNNTIIHVSRILFN